VTEFSDPLTSFIEAACVPLDSGHQTGTLDRAEAIRAAHPELATASIHAAAILGDAEAVQRFIAADPQSATSKGGPRGWDALTHLCFSRYLRLDPARSEGFVRAAEALLNAGASANTGFFESTHQPTPVWESALYGAAGVAHHPGLTRLLLERGADPNDEEVPYHAPETYDNAALKVLVESGTLNEDSLATILLRKADWHDREGIGWLLARGVNPNRMTRFGKTALHQAVLRDNALEIIKAFLDHGADPMLIAPPAESSKRLASDRSPVALAARRGRGDVLDLLARRGMPLGLEGLDRLLAACARNDLMCVFSIANREPEVVRALLAEGGTVLSEFAGNGNTIGVEHLLDLGVAVTALYTTGDPYFGIAENSTALHVAAWRAQHETVKLLIDRGAPVDARNGRGETPLMLAVRACVDSYWTYKRSPASVEALLGAGASIEGVRFPSGYSDVDRLLEVARR
jgi:ankyrin repeat protein